MSERIAGTLPIAPASPAGGTTGSLRRRGLSIAGLIAAASVFGLSYSLAGPLIAFDLERRGFGSAVIGANAAMHALGVLAIAPVLPLFCRHFGRRPTLLLAFGITALLFLLFPVLPGIVEWFVLRFGLGIGAELIFVITESWTAELSPTTGRGRIMAIYTAILSLGFVAGPALLSVLPQAGPVPFAAGAAAAILAALLIVLIRPTEAAMDEEPGLPLHRILRLSPLAMVTTLLNAAVETAGLSFLPLYASTLGWSEAGGTRLIAVLMFGAIVLQLPVGWLADRFDRRTLMIALGTGCTAGAVAWPFVLPLPAIAYPALFLWGGAFVGLYTIMLTDIGERFSGSTLVGLYGAMGLFWGLGALVGPLAVGLATDVSPQGLPVLIALACGLFTVLLLLGSRPQRRQRHA